MSLCAKLYCTNICQHTYILPVSYENIRIKAIDDRISICTKELEISCSYNYSAIRDNMEKRKLRNKYEPFLSSIIGILPGFKRCRFFPVLKYFHDIAECNLDLKTNLLQKFFVIYLLRQ